MYESKADLLLSVIPCRRDRQFGIVRIILGDCVHHLWLEAVPDLRPEYVPQDPCYDKDHKQEQKKDKVREECRFDLLKKNTLSVIHVRIRERCKQQKYLEGSHPTYNG